MKLLNSFLFSLANTFTLVSVTLESDWIHGNAIGKLLPVLAHTLVVSEQSIWHDEMERGYGFYLVVNIFTPDETQKEQLMSRIQSASFLNTLNVSCEKNKVLSGSDDKKCMKFNSITISCLEIPITGI